MRVQLYDDVAALRRGEGDRVRRFAVVLLLRVDERVVAHLSLVVCECALCAALGGADSSEVPLERHAFKRCLSVYDRDMGPLSPFSFSHRGLAQKKLCFVMLCVPLFVPINKTKLTMISKIILTCLVYLS